ncbi:MAG TPA: cytochrome c [Terracidiphilus sp.]|nr:cytochrome c [Terracidiphilus sp.]
MLKPFSLLSVVALFAVAPFVLVSPAAQEPKATAKASSQLQEKAKTLYKMDCALCHNANGDGKTDIAKDMSLNLDDWSDPKTLASKSDEALFDIIRHGKGKMPAEDAGRAKDDEVKALIQYIRSLAGAAPAAAPVAPAGASATPGSGR